MEFFLFASFILGLATIAGWAMIFSEPKYQERLVPTLKKQLEDEFGKKHSNKVDW